MNIQRLTPQVKNANFSFKSVPYKKITSAFSRDTFEISNKNVAKGSVKAAGISAIISSLLCCKNKDNNQSTDVEKCLQARDSGNFDEYKKQLLLFLNNRNYDKEFVEDISNSFNMEELNLCLSCALEKYLNGDLQNTMEELNIFERIENQDFDDNLDKKLAEYERKSADKGIPLAILTSKKDTDIGIKEIKTELSKKYNLKNMFFNNESECAGECKEALEILEKNGIHFDGTIVVTDDSEFAGINLDSSNDKCIIINPNSWQAEMNAKHLILHEIIHSIQPKTLKFRSQSIPKKYKTTADNVSEYAKDNYAHEVHCELYVKKLLCGLSEEENNLFNLLGGTFQ